MTVEATLITELNAHTFCDNCSMGDSGSIYYDKEGDMIICDQCGARYRVNGAEIYDIMITITGPEKL